MRTWMQKNLNYIYNAIHAKIHTYYGKYIGYESNEFTVRIERNLHSNSP